MKKCYSIINEEIKKLEILRSKLIRRYNERVNVEKMDYDLHNDRLIFSLERDLRKIEDLGIELQTLYRIKSKISEESE